MPFNFGESIVSQCQSTMGDELGRTFVALQAEIQELTWRWQQYRKLFGTNPQTIEILNESAPQFAWHLQQVQREGVLLHICRLLDPATSGKYENLSLYRLTTLLDQPLCDEVAADLSLAHASGKFARNWRDKVVAHRDLLTARKEGAKLISPGSRDEVAVLIGQLIVPLDRIQLHFTGGTTGYEYFQVGGDADALLDVLEEGIKSLDERQRRFEQGCDTEEDLEQRRRVWDRSRERKKAREAFRY